MSEESEEQDGPQTPREVADEMDNLMDEMMSINGEIIERMRASARELQEIQVMHLQQAQRAGQVAQYIGLGAKMTADLMGDLITSEFNIGEMVAQEYSDDNEETDEEDGNED